MALDSPLAAPYVPLGQRRAVPSPGQYDPTRHSRRPVCAGDPAPRTPPRALASSGVVKKPGPLCCGAAEPSGQKRPPGGAAGGATDGANATKAIAGGRAAPWLQSVPRSAVPSRQKKPAGQGPSHFGLSRPALAPNVPGGHGRRTPSAAQKDPGGHSTQPAHGPQASSGARACVWRVREEGGSGLGESFAAASW